jgi:hypothetical protein
MLYHTIHLHTGTPRHFRHIGTRAALSMDLECAPALCRKNKRMEEYLVGGSKDLRGNFIMRPAALETNRFAFLHVPGSKIQTAFHYSGGFCKRHPFR